MTTTSGSIARFLVLFLFGAVSQAQDVSSPAQAGDKVATPGAEPSQTTSVSNAGSGVRIVRLSQVRGEVQLDRKANAGYEVAFANLPIAQSQMLRTQQGVAEVEFEDNSTLRITPDSVIEFPVLRREASGATNTGVKLLSGTLYVSLVSTKGNEFTVMLGRDTIVLAPSSHIRIEADGSKSMLAVFSGSAQVVDQTGTVTVEKKKTFLIDATAQTPPEEAKNEKPQPFDEWDKTEMEYHSLRSVSSSYAGSSYVYGINDLNYYGAFSNLGGCGTMWRPYLASAAWDPFANGVWAWYPGAGYSWVSPYPWGWAPFHYGSWDYCPSGGWGWRPGGRWIGLTNQAIVSPNQCTACLKPPLHPPVVGRSTLVVVNMKPLEVSKIASPGNFVFRKDSAGLGVPREFGKLNKISAGVAQHGSVSAHVYEQGVPAQSGHGSTAANGANRSAAAYASSGRGGWSSSSSSSGSSGSHGASSSGSSAPSFSASSSSSFSGSSSSASSSAGASSAGGGGGGHH